MGKRGKVWSEDPAMVLRGRGCRRVMERYFNQIYISILCQK